MLDLVRPRREHAALTAESPLVGADRIIWASDYPHPDAKIPGVVDELREPMAGLPDAAQQRISASTRSISTGFPSRLDPRGRGDGTDVRHERVELRFRQSDVPPCSH